MLITKVIAYAAAASAIVALGSEVSAETLNHKLLASPTTGPEAQALRTADHDVTKAGEERMLPGHVPPGAPVVPVVSHVIGVKRPPPAHLLDHPPHLPDTKQARVEQDLHEPLVSKIFEELGPALVLGAQPPVLNKWKNDAEMMEVINFLLRSFRPKHTSLDLMKHGNRNYGHKVRRTLQEEIEKHAKSYNDKINKNVNALWLEALDPEDVSNLFKNQKHDYVFLTLIDRYEEAFKLRNRFVEWLDKKTDEQVVESILGAEFLEREQLAIDYSKEYSQLYKWLDTLKAYWQSKMSWDQVHAKLLQLQTKDATVSDIVIKQYHSLYQKWLQQKQLVKT